jgi:hypothetical protein
VTGYYNGTIDFDLGTNVTNLTSNGSDDIFILKLDSNGVFIWAKSIGGSNNRDIGESITGDSLGNVYITGRFRGTVDFDPNFGIWNLSSVGGEDIFVLKLDSNGNFIWAKSFGNDSSNWGQSIICDSENNLYITGFFSNTVDFDPSENVSNLISNGQSDIFILKLDTLGDFIFANSMGGSSSDWAYSISFDNLNNLLLTGKFYGNSDFDPETTSFLLTPNGQDDVFIVKLSSTTLSVFENTVDKILNIYPNPTTEFINLKLDDDNSLVKINLLDINGRLLKKYQFSNQKNITIKIEESSGIYLLEIINKKKKYYFKILKR